ncbi:MAG TPA: hypothetical protein VFE50_12110 [Cyclobacteriaceae bacterium]|nr:hypothetical protein [Cyclobacteriaceae bacterium]
MPQKSTKKALLIAWLIVGTLDITSATIHYLANGNKNPINILVYISSGIFGADAFKIGPPSMAILGLALHYLIALIWTVIFFTAYPRMPFLAKNRVLTGIAYGIFVWTMMSQVVVKLSNTPKGPFNLTNAIINAAILCVAIGIPLSFMAYRHYYGKQST